MSDHVKNTNARKEAAAQKLGQLNLQLIQLIQAYESLETEAWALGLSDIADAAQSRHAMLNMSLELEDEEA
ncbi:MAG: hypothetical protein ACKO0Z_06975 [Betaproteobacteria bacterium]